MAEWSKALDSSFASRFKPCDILVWKHARVRIALSSSQFFGGFIVVARVLNF